MTSIVNRLQAISEDLKESGRACLEDSTDEHMPSHVKLDTALSGFGDLLWGVSVLLEYLADRIEQEG